MSTSNLFIKFIINLLIVQFLVFTLIVGSFLFSGYVLKLEMAEQMSRVVGRMIKGGDNRGALLTLSSTQSSHFKAVGYFDQEGKRVFTLPATLNPEYFNQKTIWDKMVSADISTPIYYDENKSDMAGTIKYTFNFLAPLPVACVLWLLGVLLTVPISFRYKRLVLTELESEKIRERNSTIVEFVNEARHDQKSPLQSLYSIADDSENLNESERQRLFSVGERLTGILKDLTPEKVEERLRVKLPHKKDTPLVHVLSAVKEIVDEKRIKINKDKKVIYKIKKLEKALSSYYKMSEIDLKRILSNILDNAAEAISSSGRIEVSVGKVDGNLKIVVRDSGKGITSENLKMIGQKGRSFGKVGGEGVGLYSSIRKIESLGGSLSIQSELGSGTTVIIILPDIVIPAWAVNDLNFAEWESITVLDDDSTVHDRWSQLMSGKSTVLNNFTDVNHYFDWKNKNRDLSRDLSIIDYDLNDQNSNGIDVIKKVGGKNCLLVTNNFYEKSIQERIDGAGILMMPKTMMEMISG